MTAAGTTICLMMIVRDEAHVVRRCLDSVRPYVDHWVIVDTGSSDGTPEIIREHLRDVPGTLLERPWRDFATNRNQALAAARGHGDYLLTIDADEVLEVEAGFELPPLTADAYAVPIRLGGYRYLRRQLVRGSLPWRWVGVVHEYLACDQSVEEVVLPGITTVAHAEGARSRDPLKYRRDAVVLEQALLDEPDNSRYVFYLAQSYHDAGEHELALHHYERRAAMGGWADEVWHSRYQAALIAERLGRPWTEVQQRLLEAYADKPDRAEPLYRVATHYQESRQWALAHLFLSRAMAIPFPAGNDLFVEEPVYRHRIPIDFAAACFYVGDHETSIEICNRMLRDPGLPPYLIDLVAGNRRHGVEARQPVPASAEGVGPLVACLSGEEPAAALDEAIESLLAQECPDFRAVVLLDGPAAGAQPRLPAGDGRFTLHRCGGRRGWWPRLAAWLASCDPDTLVLVPAGGLLADRQTVERLRRYFADPSCELVYGQSRGAGGELSRAAPAKNRFAFLAAGLDLPARCPFAFRARLCAELAAAPAGGGEAPARALLVELLRVAGFDRTRFCEQPLTVLPRPVPAPAASPNGGRPARRRRRQPLVSCLMVTHDRVRLARRAIDSFAAQTWRERELVVVSDGPAHVREALAEHVAARRLEGVRFVVPEEGGSTLGALRNRSMAEARGEVLCQWDDDDWSHPERLARQAERLLADGAGACFLTEHLQLYEDERRMVWLDWRNAGRGSKLHPGTLMMRRDDDLRYPEEGEAARRGEDSAYLQVLAERVAVTTLDGPGYLFLYTYHGRNTFGREHHERLTPMMVPAEVTRRHEAEIRQVIARLDLPKPIVVAGPEGPVFVSNDHL